MIDRLVVNTDADHVVLRELTREDAPAYFAAVDANRDHLSQFGDETSAKYPDLDSVIDSLEHPIDPCKVRMGIWDGETFVGSINLTPDEDDQTAELGYWLDARHTGNGYATLATKALSAFARERYSTVYAEVIEGNKKSAKVLERSGFRETAREAGRISFELAFRELSPDKDIEAMLDTAFATPLNVTLKSKPKVSPEELGAREAYYSRQASLPRDVKIQSYDAPPEAYEVWTESPEAYPLLLAQAMRRLDIVNGNSDLGLEITPRLEKTAKHEAEHGKMARALGLGSRYGVRILHDPNEDIWALGPFHALVGNEAGVIFLTRLEEAAIAVAPEDPSPGDLHSAHSAGFSSREQVLAQLYEVHPHLHPSSEE